MKAKCKGSNAERELIHLFWGNAWAAIRVAGSGSIKYPVPDILAGNGVKRLAIECKACGDDTKYIEKREVTELIEFCRIYGAEPLLGIRFNNQKWRFLRPEDLEQSDKNYIISKQLALTKGKDLFEIMA